jgi:hypothetical protein
VNEIVNSFLLVYARLFRSSMRVGSAPIVLGLTRQCSDQKRDMLV